MGRRDTEIWEHFNKITKRGCKYLKGKCKYCGSEYTTNARRMKKHIIRCEECPKNIKCKIQSNFELQKQIKLMRREKKEKYPESVMARKNMDTLSRTAISNIKETNALDTLLARAFFSSGIPFSFIENDYFQQYIKKLRPLYILPNMNTLSTTLLNKEYNFIKTFISQEIDKADYASLMTDGCIDGNGSPIINIFLSIPKPVFIKSIKSDENSYTDEYLTDVLFNVIEETGPQKVTALVTDITLDMKLLRTLVKQKYYHIQCFQGVSYGLSLLEKDILSIFLISETIADCRELIKVLKTEIPKEILKNYQEQLYSYVIDLTDVEEIRWSSINTSLQNLIKAKKLIQEAVADRIISSMIPAYVRTNILNEDFWQNISNFVNILNPIFDLVYSLQTHCPRISYILPGIKGIENCLHSKIGILDIQLQTQIQDVFYAQKELMLCEIHYVATQLDPKLKSFLTEEEEMLALNHIMEMSTQYNFDEKMILRDLVDFKAKEGLWSESALWRAAESSDCKSWWKAFCHSKELCNFACRILDVPVNSAFCECNETACLHTKTTKRKTVKTVKNHKQVAIMFNLNVFKNTDLNNMTGGQFEEVNLLEENVLDVNEVQIKHELEDSDESLSSNKDDPLDRALSEDESLLQDSKDDKINLDINNTVLKKHFVKKYTNLSKIDRIKNTKAKKKTAFSQSTSHLKAKIKTNENTVQHQSDVGYIGTLQKSKDRFIVEYESDHNNE